MIEVDGLVFDYPGRRALHDVSLSVRAGAITALVGPNGSGKTTLLRCIAALAEPLAGRIVVDGVDVIAQPRECHSRIGYLSDFHGLWELLSVQRSLMHVARAHGLSRGELSGRVDEVIAQVGLAEYRDALAGTLSRGLRQRLAIGQSIIHRPRVLLLDEPASGLDPEARYELSALLRRLGGGDICIVVSSHILAELDDYCTDMLVLRDGRVVDHQPVAGAAAGLVAFRLEVEGDLDTAQAVVVATPGVASVHQEGGGLRVRLRDEPGARQRLLRHLLDQEVAVTGFGAARERLQEAYMARVRGGPTEDA